MQPLKIGDKYYSHEPYFMKKILKKMRLKTSKIYSTYKMG